MPAFIQRRLPHLAILFIVSLLYWAGALQRLDNLFMDIRAGFVERPATGEIVIVQMDERSLRLLDVWPWPRRYYAEAIDRLIDDGAGLIAIDIDFSSRATAGDDDALEAALARAGERVVLPVFKQHGSIDRDASSLAETGPRERFARHVRLGAVVVRPEPDGLIRQADDSMYWREGLLPSFPALLAETAGPGDGRFYIDYGIRPESIPHISFVDVMRGEFPEGIFKDRKVIIGAIAVELGDQLPVPRYVTLPGAFVLTLAAESLIQDRAILRLGVVPTLVLTLLAAMLLGPFFAEWSWYRGLAAVAGWSVLVFLGSLGLRAVAPASLDISTLLLVPLLSYGVGLVSVINRQTLRIFRQSMSVLHRSAQMRQIVEGSFDAIFSIDHFGEVTVFNPAAEKLFGIPASDIIGKSPDHLLRVADADGAYTLPISAALDQEQDTSRLLEAEAQIADGSARLVEISLQATTLHSSPNPLERRQSGRAFYFVTARDITERRLMEEAQQRAMDEAISSNRAKSEFLAAISHELRTPLNAIIGFSEIMKDEMMGALGNQEYVTYAGDIHASGQHLLAIVNDILDITRVESGRRELADNEIRLDELADLCVRLIRGRSEARGLDVRNNIPVQLPSLRGDAQAVRQILINLLSNAAKFTEAGEVVVDAGVLEGGGLEIVVRDTGIGIPANEIEKIVEPFYQVDSSLARKFEGTGLGLALVKALMTLHGGELLIESAEGEGTSVHCVFPASRTVMLHGVTAMEG